MEQQQVKDIKELRDEYENYITYLEHRMKLKISSSRGDSNGTFIMKNIGIKESKEESQDNFIKFLVEEAVLPGIDDVNIYFILNFKI